MNIVPQLLALLPLDSVPTPIASAPPGTNKVTDLLGWLKWGGLAVCVAGLIIAGAVMSINSRRGEGGEHVGKIGMVLAGVIVISAAASLVGFLAG